MRKKLLISAYACHPYRGSEHGIGWYYSLRLADYYDLFVITRADNRSEIEEALRRSGKENIKFIYIDLPEPMRFWKRGEKGLYIYYFIWQVLAFFTAIRLHRKEHFKAVWHLTFGNMVLPTFLPFINARFIWGPIGGGNRIPLSFWKYISLRGKINELMRLVVLFLLRINPLFYLYCKKAAIILVRTRETARLLPSRFRKKAVLFQETAMDPEDLPVLCNGVFKANRLHEETKTVFITVGRLMWHKGIVFSLYVLNRIYEKVPDLDWKYKIIGSGPEYGFITKQIGCFPFKDRVKLIGKLPRERVIEEYKSADIFLLLSGREGGSWALLEAMLCGLVPVVLDAGGSSEIVTDECGIIAYSETPSSLIEILADKLIEIMKKPECISEIGLRARERVLNELSWEKKISELQKLVDQVL
ncbi:MAG: glycosyltransferase [Candidatus Hydrothermae bacterium]|nr:glycosyltransferase [Candidatus Hydrothermae bacterium]HOK23760.1 glycosyltransferase [Candidatus Hydrothermia bacterium]